MARQHGIEATSHESLLIDSGAVYFGWTDMTTLGTRLGTTRGGNTFTLEQEIKEMEADGLRGPTKGWRRITMVKATLTVNLLTHTLTSLKQLVVGSSSAVHAVSWDAITRALVIDNASDYISNIALIGEVSGNANALGIVLTDVICDSNMELGFEDKEEGVVAATFTGHFDPTDLAAGTDTEPWSIIYPQ